MYKCIVKLANSKGILKQLKIQSKMEMERFIMATNNFVGTGRLTKDVDFKPMQNGRNLARFTIAISRNYKDDNGKSITDYLPCVVWGKLADAVSNSLSKGSRCTVVGSVHTGSYDGQDGKKVYTTEINVDSVEFLDPKPQNANANNGQTNQQPQGQQGGYPQQQQGGFPQQQQQQGGFPQQQGGFPQQQGGFPQQQGGFPQQQGGFPQQQGGFPQQQGGFPQQQGGFPQQQGGFPQPTGNNGYPL